MVSWSRSLLAILFGVVLVAGLTGCGGGDRREFDMDDDDERAAWKAEDGAAVPRGEHERVRDGDDDHDGDHDGDDDDDDADNHDDDDDDDEADGDDD